MDKKYCSAISYFGEKLQEFIGVAILVVAVLLTFLTQSSLGIFGMFILGIVLIHRSHGKCCWSSCSSCCHDHHESFGETLENEVCAKEKPAVKKASPKKTV